MIVRLKRETVLAQSIGCLRGSIQPLFMVFVGALQHMRSVIVHLRLNRVPRIPRSAASQAAGFLCQAF